MMDKVKHITLKWVNSNDSDLLCVSVSSISFMYLPTFEVKKKNWVKDLFENCMKTAYINIIEIWYIGYVINRIVFVKKFIIMMCGFNLISIIGSI